MSCCAVGICAITDLKRAKNSVQTSNCAGFEQRHDLAPDRIGIIEPDLAHRAQVDRLDDAAFELALELVEALAADAEEA